MKLITRDTDYAIRALAYMAKNRSEIYNVPALMTDLDIPKPFLRKILQALTQKGILNSYKGVGGGFKLAKDPVDICVTDVMEAFQGRLSLNECFFKKKICPGRSTCPLKKRIGKISEYVEKELRSITVKDLI